MIAGWRELGEPALAALDTARRAPIVALLEGALDGGEVRAVQIEHDPGGLTLVSVWATEVSAAVAALLDEGQADGQRVGVSFVACRAGHGPLDVAAAAGVLWLVREDAAAPARP